MFGYFSNKAAPTFLPNERPTLDTSRLCANTLRIAPKGGTPFYGAYYFSFGKYIVIYDIDEEKNNVVVHMVVHSRQQWKSIFMNRL